MDQFVEIAGMRLEKSLYLYVMKCVRCEKLFTTNNPETFDVLECDQCGHSGHHTDVTIIKYKLEGKEEIIKKISESE